MGTTWRTKNLEEDLATARGLLGEEQGRSAMLETALENLQRENAQLKNRLAVQNDGNDLLRDVEQSHRANPMEEAGLEQRSHLCGSVCSIFRRRR
eukprot:NODE_7065_length_464_cov_195.457213.p1 GENE.NODE_7065_length_464_cov_195.457213~~NODE_7065_length_464_cov_195.457213.p1  ORF type:complete len:108 (+),score=38.57 NODE_7065_length_464_cov_195.457213:42-326(+)